MIDDRPREQFRGPRAESSTLFPCMYPPGESGNPSAVSCRLSHDGFRAGRSGTEVPGWLLLPRAPELGPFVVAQLSVEPFHLGQDVGEAKRQFGALCEKLH